MNLNQLIKDIHQNSIVAGNFDCPNCTHSNNRNECTLCDGTGEYCNVKKCIDYIYCKLLVVVRLFQERRFSRIDEFDNDQYLSSFKESFVKSVTNTFEGELTALLFASFDLMGYLMDVDVLELDDVDDLQSSMGIEEELTYFAVRLEEIEHLGRMEIFEELLKAIKRIFYICKNEGISIRTHIRLNLLYFFSYEVG